MLSKLLSLTFLAASASAAAIPADAATGQYSWQVNQYASTCTAATCRYTFKVSGAQGPANQPPFDASGCVGTSVQGDFKACSIIGMDVPGSVEAQQYNFGSDIGAIISVRYTFEQNGVRYTYTGNQSVAHTNGEPATEFQVTPSEVFAVPVEA